MQKINVLFVNGDPQDLDNTSDHLEDSEYNFNITKTETIEDTSTVFAEEEFDAVVFFNDDPNSNLSSLLRDIKKKGKDIPSIIYSDEKEADLAIEALNSGADAYILKGDGDDNLDKLKETILQKVDVDTEKKDVNDLLSIKEEDFRSFMNSITDWVWEMDKDGIHTYSNSAVKDILGYEIDEVVGHSAWKLWPEEDKKKVEKEKFQENLKDGEKWENFAGKFRHKDGSKKYLESTGIPVYDDDGDLLGYRGIDRDITERRRAQKRERFLHSLLRHDIKNKIQVTKGYLQLMEDFDTEDELQDYLKKAKESLNEEENLIDKISYLRKIEEKDEIETVKLNRYIDRSINNNSSLIENSGVDIQTDGIDVEVKGGELLEELFSNLIENSLNHSSCEKIWISAKKDSDEIKVMFEDDGKGILEDEKDTIFDKKSKGTESKGSGLGLYLVKRIVNTYGGEITVKDSDMGGARFDIILNSN